MTVEIVGGSAEDLTDFYDRLALSKLIVYLNENNRGNCINQNAAQKRDEAEKNFRAKQTETGMTLY